MPSDCPSCPTSADAVSALAHERWFLSWLKIRLRPRLCHVCVDEPTAAAIRKAYQDSGELAAVVELRRHFPGIADNANAWLLWSALQGWQADLELTG